MVVGEGEDDGEVVGTARASTMVGVSEEVDSSTSSHSGVCVGEELISLGGEWWVVASEGEDDGEVVGTARVSTMVGVSEEVDWPTKSHSEVCVGEELISLGGDW